MKKIHHEFTAGNGRAGIQKRKVLIADDEETSRRVFGHFVSKMGYEAIMVNDGRECVQTMAEESPDVVLLDINMPVLDGFEVMQHAKSQNDTTPIIIITASHEIPSAVKCIKLGAYEYLTKPLNIDRLEIVMRNALQDSSLQSQVKMLKKRA
nr:response regulator [Chlorobium phaeovibrioides]